MFFDLEQQIMRCWTILDDLEDTEYNKALHTVYSKQFDKLFEIFEKMCEEYRTTKL